MSETTSKHHDYSRITFLLLANGITWLGSFLTNPEQAPALSALSARMPWAIVIFLQSRLGKEQGIATPT